MSCNMNPYSYLNTLMICTTKSQCMDRETLTAFLDFTTMFLESSTFTPDNTPEQPSSDMTL